MRQKELKRGFRSEFTICKDMLLKSLEDHPVQVPGVPYYVSNRLFHDNLTSDELKH